MKTISPLRTAVTSFSSSFASSSGSSSSSSSSSSSQGNNVYDSGEYVLSVAATTDDGGGGGGSGSGSGASPPLVAAALSDRSIVLYDSRAGCVIDRIEGAHDGPISEICFFPPSSSSSSTSSSLLSAGHDGFVKVWDFRCRNGGGGGGGGGGGSSSGGGRPASSSRLPSPRERALCASLGYGGTLAAVGTDGSKVSFFDFRRATGGGPSCRGGALLGSYVDAHTDDVTCVRFETVTTTGGGGGGGSKTVLASASEDGLVAVHDPSEPDEGGALVSVLNVGSPVRRVGFFGPGNGGLWALTGNETMCAYHWDSGQKVCDVGGGGGAGLRRALSDAESCAAGAGV